MLTSSNRVVRYDLTYPFDTDYVINFKFWSSVQIHAVLSFDDGTEDLPLVLSTDYTLSAPGDTGTLTKVSDWNHAAVRLTIYRELDLEQETDYRNGEAVDLDLLEKDFDYAVARDQQIAETISRGVTVPITDEAASNELPGAVERANKFLGFDADGVPFAAEGIPSVPASSWAATLLDDEDADEARVTLDAAQNSALGRGTFAPVTGYTPAAGDVVELLHDGTIRKALRAAWTQIDAANTASKIRVCKLDATHFIVQWSYSTLLKAMVGTVDLNDLTVSWGSAVTVATGSTYAGHGISALTSSLALSAYSPTLGQLYVVTLSVSGNVITVNTPVAGAATATVLSLMDYDSSDAVLVWTTNGTTNVTASVVSVSGITPTINASSASTVVASTMNGSMGNVAPDLGMVGVGVGASTTTPFPAAVALWVLSGTTLSSPGGFVPWPWGATGGSNSCSAMFLQGHSVYAMTAWAPDAAVTKRVGICLYNGRRGGVYVYDPCSPHPITEVPLTSNPFCYMKAINPSNGIIVSYWTSYCDGGGTSLVHRFHILKHNPHHSFDFHWSDCIEMDFSYATTLPVAGDACELPGGTVIVAFGVNGAGYNKVGVIRRRDKVIGVAVDAVGTVQLTGVFTTTGLSVGAKYYLDSTGALSTTEGECAIGMARSATELFLNVKQGI